MSDYLEVLKEITKNCDMDTQTAVEHHFRAFSVHVTEQAEYTAQTKILKNIDKLPVDKVTKAGLTDLLGFRMNPNIGLHNLLEKGSK